jgi:hypothetical protein
MRKGKLLVDCCIQLENMSFFFLNFLKKTHHMFHHLFLECLFRKLEKIQIMKKSSACY